MTSFTKKEAEALWRKYNTDGNDTLSVDEVMAVIKSEMEKSEEGVDDLDALVKEKYAYFRQSEAKALTKDQFIDGMVKATQCVDLKSIFNKLDKDGSKKLTKAELKSGLSEFKNFSKDQVDILIDELAEDADKEYDIDEFVDAVAFSEYFVQTYG